MSNKSKNIQQKMPLQRQRTAELLLHSGPLPEPSEMRAYNEIVPDAASRIIAMAEREQEARIQARVREDDRLRRRLDLDAEEQRQSAQIIDINKRNSLIGLWMGFLYAALMSILTVVLICTGHTVSGGIFGCTTLAGIVSAFIYGAHLRKSEILSSEREKSPGKED